MSVVKDLRTVLVHRGFRKLFAVRLVSQCGDGMIQAGLATLFFFNPQNLATAGAVAAAFAILLLPFTIVAPFAGPLLDRWRRRQVLLIGNALRVVITLALAAIMVTQGVSVGIYVLALVALGDQPVPARRALGRTASRGPARTAADGERPDPDAGSGQRRRRRRAGLPHRRRRTGGLAQERSDTHGRGSAVRVRRGPGDASRQGPAGSRSGRHRPRQDLARGRRRSARHRRRHGRRRPLPDRGGAPRAWRSA